MTAKTSERVKGSNPVPGVPGVAPGVKPARWTAPYRAMRGGCYYRFYWQARDRSGKLGTHHIHICGGRADNPKAIANRAAVDAAIAQGQSDEQIRLLIKSFPRSKGNHRKISRE